MAGSAVPALRAYDDTINWPWLILMVCMITGGGILMWMHGRRDTETQRAADEQNEQTLRDSLAEKDREKEKERQSYEALVDEMTTGVFNLVLGLEETTPKGRLAEMRIVRKAVLGQVRTRLGPDATGVRANLFAVESVDPPVLGVDRWGYDGGNGLRSTRKFRPGDTTFDRAIEGEAHYVPDVAELPKNEKPGRGYKSFSTYPVASDDRLFGILTIDAPGAEDITPFDVKLLGFFAGVIALSFSSQQDCPYVPMGNLSVPCDTGTEGEEVGSHD